MKIARVLSENRRLYAASQDGKRFFEIRGSLLHSWEVSDTEVFPERLLAPVDPVQILAVGVNYRAHAEEMGSAFPEYPVIFMKGVGSLLDPDQAIRIPEYLGSDQVDYEVELAVLIGRTCKNVTEDQALEYVLGYTVANDVTARDWQKRWGGGQWCRAKSFDTFCPVGPWLVTADEIPDPNTLNLCSRVNGEVRQNSTTADMIFKVSRLIAFLSGSTTLPAGTLILTGTPPGVGMAMTPPRYLVPGDRVEVEISGIGVLANPVEWESTTS